MFNGEKKTSIQLECLIIRFSIKMKYNVWILIDTKRRKLVKKNGKRKKEKMTKYFIYLMKFVMEWKILIYKSFVSVLNNMLARVIALWWYHILTEYDFFVADDWTCFYRRNDVRRKLRREGMHEYRIWRIMRTLF